MFKYFKPEEILSPEGLMQYKKGHFLIQGFALKSLNVIRENIEEPIYINHAGLKYRGYRSPDENAILEGSADFSRHVQGIAFDCTVTSQAWDRLAMAAILSGAKGIGYYPNNHFMHIDFRTSQDVICWISKNKRLENFTIKTESIDSDSPKSFLEILKIKFRICH